MSNEEKLVNEYDYDAPDLISELGQSFSMPKLFVKLTGSHELGIILNQINFWTGKSTKLKNGWFSKSYEQWNAELFIPERSMRRYINKLIENNLIEKRIIKVNGIRTLCLRAKRENINNGLLLLISNMDKNVPNRPTWPDSQTANLAGSSIYTYKTTEESIASPSEKKLPHAKNGVTPPTNLTEPLKIKNKLTPFIETWNNIAKDNPVLKDISNKRKKDYQQAEKAIKDLLSYWPELGIRSDLPMTPELFGNILHDVTQANWWFITKPDSIRTITMVLRQHNFEEALGILKLNTLRKKG